MRIGAKTLWVFSLWFLFVLGIAQAFGDDAKLVSPDLYELRFLGVKVNKDTKTGNNNGLFLFIWKGGKPTKVLGTDYGPDQNIRLFPDFSVHTPGGWKSAGDWCGTGSRMITIQPGQVISFSMDMSWVEHDWPGNYDIKSADKARFEISSSDGKMQSEEFPLPLK